MTYRVTLRRLARGTYTWEISIPLENETITTNELAVVDRALKQRFPHFCDSFCDGKCPEVMNRSYERSEQ